MSESTHRPEVARQQAKGYTNQEAAGRHGYDRDDYRVLDSPQYASQQITALEVGARPVPSAGGLSYCSIVLICILVGRDERGEYADRIQNDQHHHACHSELFPDQPRPSAPQMASATPIFPGRVEIRDYGPDRLLVQLYLILGSTNE